MPSKDAEGKGSVYVFGGKVNSYEFQTANYRYDIASGEWHELPDMPIDAFSFNLIPLDENRYILLVCDHSILFDTEEEVWIVLAQKMEVENPNQWSKV